MSSELLKLRLVRWDQVEPRDYQLRIAETCLRKNTLVVLPTGLGKTVIAALVAAWFLEHMPEKKVLMLAPTKALVEQHEKTFRKILNEDLTVALTGKVSPEKRSQYYKKSRIIFATPQVIRNDLLAGRLDPKSFSLVIFDECHRATGNYPYVFIAKEFLRRNPEVRVLGLTASPGGSMEQIREIMRNLGLTAVEARTDESPDVRAYIKGIKLRWVRVPLYPELRRALELLGSMESRIIRQLRNLGYLATTERLSKKTILELKRLIVRDFVNNKVRASQGYTLVNELLKLVHLRELLESQGVPQAREYARNLLKQIQEGRGTRYLRSLILSQEFQELLGLLRDLSDRGVVHPKLEVLRQILERESFRKAIIFTQLRSTAKLVAKDLQALGYQVFYFSGQRDMDQRTQREVLSRFRASDTGILVATSVAEEGLDVPEVDLVVFYEPIPSEIRAIQRKGRTGRKVPGKVIILVSPGIDEAYLWSSRKKEALMKQLILELSRSTMEMLGKQQLTLEELLESERSESQEGNMSFSSARIIVDDREMKSPVVEKLREEGISLEFRRLEVGDYVVGDVIVERKRADDFAKSLLDNRLFEQLKQLRDSGSKSMLVVEGDLLSAGLRPEALYGAVQSILLDYGIPVIFTSGPKETGLFLAILAKRFAKRKASERVVTRKPKSISRIQEQILMQFPNIGLKKARELLRRFGSLMAVFNADLVSLRDVLGEVTARKFKEVLEHRYSEEEQ